MHSTSRIGQLPVTHLACLLLACLAVAQPITAQKYKASSEKKQEPDEPPEAQEPEEEESEVLEERRRGFVEEEPEIEPVRKPWAKLSWDFGPRLELFRGDMVILVGGRVHVDGATFKTDPEIEEDFGSAESGVKLRRAFVETGGVYKSFEFNFWVNFAEDFQLFTGDELVNSDPDFRNVFVGLFDLPVVGGFRAGFFKEPFGLEEITSSNDITFMERSLTDAFVERRNLGVMWHKRFTNARRITASLGLFLDTSTQLESSDGYGVTGRLTTAPWLRDDGRGALHFGAAATYRKTSEDQLRFQSRPESSQAQVLVDTGTFPADRDFRAGVEAALVLGSFSLQSEYMWTHAETPVDLHNPEFQSVYVMASYVLSGEHRSYRPRVGAFGAVHPERPFPTDGAGAWELTTRYSYLDLNSGDIEGGVLHDWTLGLNWYTQNNSRIMFNYIAAHPEGYEFEHIFQLRLQASF